MDIDIAAAHRNVTYNPLSGEFRWIVDKRGPVKAGDIAGSVGAKGYYFVKIEQRKYPAARLAWAMHHGRQPQGEVDHRDGKRLNNRIANLREATRGQNCDNVKGEGVRYEPDRAKWLARICVDRLQINLGRFGSEAEAKAAFEAAKIMLRGDFARGV